MHAVSPVDPRFLEEHSFVPPPAISSPMKIDLSNRTAIVTGAGRGIGRQIAQTFAEAGSNIVAAARTKSEISETITQVEEEGVEGLAVPTDLENPDQIENLVERTVAEFGYSDILVNNAALNLTNSPADQTLGEIDSMTRVNLRSVFLLTRRWAAQFRTADQERGRVINISSNSALFGVPAMTYYGATNAGVKAMTRGFATTYAQDNITVNCVIPGLTEVERIEELLAKQDRGEIERIHVLSDHLLGRPAKPEEVAYACLVLTHELADYITGTDILVDGGLEATRPMYEF